MAISTEFPKKEIDNKLRNADNQGMDAQTLIQDLRSAGLRQQQIAELAGLSQGYVCDLEKGRYGKRIGYETYKRISDLHLRYFTLDAALDKANTQKQVFALPEGRQRKTPHG